MNTEKLREVILKFYRDLNTLHVRLIPADESFVKSVAYNNVLFINSIFDDIDADEVEANVSYFAENLIAKYSQYLPISLCNAIFALIESLTVKDNEMSICPIKLKEVLHDIVNGVGRMLNASESMMAPARAKIESVFEEPSSPEEVPAASVCTTATAPSDVTIASPALDAPSADTVAANPSEEPTV